MSAVEQGHGRVFPRPDGTFAKCFGPPHCMACQLDADAKERALAMPLASRLALARALVPGWAVVPREPHSGMEQPAGELADQFGISMAAALDVYRGLVAVAHPLTAAEEPPHGP